MKTYSEIQDKFGVFWYNDPELFEWSNIDFEKKASEFAAAGINIVMTFSCTHFRWSCYPYWDLINERLAMLVKACHKFNIRVVEHHSSHLTFNPRDKAEWDYAETVLKVRKSTLTSFPGLRDFIASGDPEIAPGVYLSSCRQIDGRTGEYARTGYHGYGLCFNNPDYRKRYFDYLATVYQTGVDGIMTDDVQYFGSGNACACKYCREKFKNKYGYDLPLPDNWGRFYGDYQNPAFVAWLRFRQESTADFQEAVTAHARSFGYNLLRPNYSTSTFVRNHTGYPFEKAGNLWSHVFQENMFSSVMRASWPSWTADAMHRRAMGKKYGVEPMSMFYPARYDDYYFCWALSRAWGHLLMATPEGGDLNSVEMKFHAYEQLHPRWTKQAEIEAEIAFMQPRSSLDFAADPVEGSGRPFSVWTQAGVFRNLAFDIIFEDEPLERFQQYSLIVIAGGTMLSDQQLELLKEYCRNGGRVLVSGPFGIYNTDGSLREHPEEIFGFTADLSKIVPTKEGVFCWDDRQISLPEVAESYVLSNVKGAAETIAAAGDGKVLGVSAMDGRFIWLAGGVHTRGVEASHYAFVISRWVNGQPARAEAPARAADYIYSVPGSILAMLADQTWSVKVSESGFWASSLTALDGSEMRITLVNVSNTLAKPPEKISHSDIFSNFTEKSIPLAETLKVSMTGKTVWNVEKATAFSPEFSGGKDLQFSISDNDLEITVEPGTFAGYLEIQLILKR